MNYYNYLFYFMYRIAGFFGNDGIFAEGFAFFATAMIPWLNFLAVINIVEIRTRESFLNPIVVIALYILYLILTYLYFFTSRRYLRIVERENQSKNNLLKNLLAFIYVIGSLILHFYLTEQRRAMGKL